MATNIGPKIGIEGEKEYRDALKNIIQQTKTLGSEMEAVAASFGKNADAQEKAAARGAVLDKQIKAQEALVEKLAEAVSKSAESYGETDTRTLKWKESLNKANADLGKMRNSVGDLSGDLDDVSESMDKSAKGASLFGDMLKANLASEAIVAGIRKTAAALKTVAASVIDLGKKAISAFADQEQLVGGVETLFGDAAGAVRDYAQSAFSTAGLSANEYMETVTGFSASLIAAVAGDTQLAAQKADMALRDMSDNANKMGTSMEMIQNAYQGFAKGNMTMLDNLKLGRQKNMPLAA